MCRLCRRAQQRAYSKATGHQAEAKWRAKNPQSRKLPKEYTLEASRRAIADLQTGYVRRRLAAQMNIAQRDVPMELVPMKRESLNLRRLLKEMQRAIEDRKETT